MYRNRITALLGVLLIHVMAGCVLGPQPEPPDVTESPSAELDDAFGGRFYDDGSDEAVADGAYDGDDCPCEPGLAGGEWNCDNDRDGHEPPDDSGGGEIENTHRQAELSDPRSTFFGDDEEPDPTESTHFIDTASDDDEIEDDDDGIGVVDP